MGDMTIVVTMAKLLFAMLLGFFLNKADILDAHTSKKLSAVIINVSCPLLILTSVTTLEGGDKSVVWKLLTAGVVTYLLVPFFSLLMVKLLRIPQNMCGVYRGMLMFSNNSFMGYPVIEALYGSSAIFYSTIFHFGFNILFFSYGIFLIAKDAGNTGKFQIKQLINAGMISAVAALILYFCDISLPDVVIEPMKFVGNITTPLSMLIIGSNMGACHFKEMFTEKKLYVISLLRLVIIPLLTYYGMHLVTQDATLIGIVTITMGMPVASLVAMGSSAYPKQGKVASIGVVLTTLLSMVTIPVMALLLTMSS